MKKVLKGFTLIELIIVMAILSILMVAVIRMFKPIRDTFVDTTYYEAQRTTQNGIITYIAESTRFATDLGVYCGGSYTSAQAALNEFAKTYAGDTDTALQNTVKEKAEIIVICNSGTFGSSFTFNNETWKGAVLRRKTKNTSVTDAYGKNADFRIAMGNAYYGGKDYTTTLTLGTAGFDMTVAADLNPQNRAGKAGNQLVKVNGDVFYRNLDGGAHGVSSPGKFDDKYTGAAATTGNIYIVWLNEKV